MFTIDFSTIRRPWADKTERELLVDASRRSEISYSFDRQVTLKASGVDLSKAGFTPLFGLAFELAYAFQELVEHPDDPGPIDVDGWPMEMKLVGDDQLCLTTYWWVPIEDPPQPVVGDDTYEIGRACMTVTEFKQGILEFLDRIYAHLLELYPEAHNSVQLKNYISGVRLFLQKSPR